MKVAIIGAGNVGKALATSIGRAGHHTIISASTPETTRAAAEAVGAEAAHSNAAAAREADLVILAVPYAATAEVADSIRTAAGGKPIVDVTNPLTADYSGLATDSSAAEELQRRLPQSGVVKAFNTIFAANQAQPAPAIDAFVAGDDPKAKQAVISLAESIGFTALDVGPLTASRYLEGMAFMNIGLNAVNGWSWTSAWKLER